MAKIKGIKKKRSGDGPAPAVLLDHSIGYLVRRTFRNLTRSLELRLAEHGLSTSMWFFLRALWERDGQTQKELSEELGLRQPTTVSAMDNLEGRGLIRRVRNLEDRRKSNIYLTEAGKALRQHISKFANEVNEIALQDFTPAEVELLERLLIRLNNSILADQQANGLEPDNSERD
ncbi:MAG: MarR family transcriptional regulator [Bradyrhizobium sp.]|nr:MarR family transcriptional regulator [Bradyrhizobium sp.]